MEAHIISVFMNTQKLYHLRMLISLYASQLIMSQTCALVLLTSQNENGTSRVESKKNLSDSLSCVSTIYDHYPWILKRLDRFHLF